MSLEAPGSEPIPVVFHQPDIISALPDAVQATLSSDEFRTRLNARADVSMEDALQEAYIAHHLDTAEGVRPSIRASVTKAAIMRATRPDRITTEPSAEVDTTINNDDFGVTDAVFVESLLGRLPGRLREIVRLRAFEDRTFGQIGHQFGVSHQNIERLYKRALQSLREGMESSETEAGQDFQTDVPDVSEAAEPSRPVVYYAPIDKPNPESYESFSLDPEKMKTTPWDLINRYLDRLREYLDEQREAGRQISRDHFLKTRFPDTNMERIASAIHRKCKLIVFAEGSRELKDAWIDEGEVNDWDTLPILEEVLRSTRTFRSPAERREKLADMTGIYVPPELELTELDTADFDLRVSDLYGFHNVRGMSATEELDHMTELRIAASRARVGALGTDQDVNQ